MSYWNDIEGLPTFEPVLYGTGRIKRDDTIRLYVLQFPDESEWDAAGKLTKIIGKYVSPGEVRKYWPHERKLYEQRWEVYRAYSAELENHDRALKFDEWLPLWERFCQQAQASIEQTQQRLTDDFNDTMANPELARYADYYRERLEERLAALEAQAHEAEQRLMSLMAEEAL